MLTQRERIELLKDQVEAQLRQLEILLAEIPDPDKSDRKSPAKDRARKLLLTTNPKSK
jgi:hypothetical protein